MYRLLVCFYIVGIFALSSIPSSSIPRINTALPIDKVVHFLEYGIFSFLLFKAILPSGRISADWLVILVILSAGTLGAIDESYQTLIGRNASVYDWISDFLGATIVSLCLFLNTKSRKSTEAKE